MIPSNMPEGGKHEYLRERVLDILGGALQAAHSRPVHITVHNVSPGHPIARAHADRGGPWLTLSHARSSTVPDSVDERGPKSKRGRRRN
eukprot:321572-Rhodomonas_salina.2